MTQASPLLAAFNAGELTPYLDGRADLQKYGHGCKTLENYTALVQGPARKRSGLRYVKEVRDTSKNIRLIEFEFNTEQAYVLEFSDQMFSVYKDGAAVLETAQAIAGAPGISQADPALLDLGGPHGFLDGDEVFIDNIGAGGMTEVENRFFTVRNKTANTFDLETKHPTVGYEDASGYAAFTTGDVARHVTVEDAVGGASVPWADTDLDALEFTQSGDTLYITHKDHPPHKITRSSHTAWTCTEMDFLWQPFQGEDDANTITLVFEAVGGGNSSNHVVGATRELTASAALFSASDVGRYIKFREQISEHQVKWKAGATPAIGTDWYYEGNVYRSTTTVVGGTAPPVHDEGLGHDGDGADAGNEWEYRHSGEGYVQITAFNSTTNVDITVIRTCPDSPGLGFTGGGATLKWAWEAWSDSSVTAGRGYPRAVTFFEDRLWFAGSTGLPQTLWASRTGDYENFRVLDLDDSGLTYTLNTDKVNVIEWITGDSKLGIGTAGGEFIAAAAREDEVLSPDNIRVVRHSTYGSKEAVMAAPVENVTLFVQRAGRKVREFVFDFDTDRYVAPDLTVLSEHITAGKIKHMRFQQEPNRVVWCVLEDGGMVGMTYERSQEVVGWHRFIPGGTTVKVKTHAVVPSVATDSDRVWVVVERSINGNTKQYVEYLEADWDRSDDIEDAFFVDSGLTYSGASATTITGLRHLIGETVSVLADGAIVADKVVSATGTITLDEGATKVTAGLPYTAKLQTMRLEGGASDGTSQGKTKRITNVTLRLDQTGAGLLYGPSLVDLDEVDFRDSYDLMDNPVPLYDGDLERLDWPEGYEQAACICLTHSTPYPCTIISIMPQVVTQDR